MKGEKLRSLAYLSVIAVFAMLLCYVFVRYLFAVALPFILAWAIAFSTRPLAAWIHRHTGISKRALRVLLTLLLTLGSLTLLGFLIGRVAVELWHLVSGLASSERLAEMLAFFEGPLESLFGEGSHLAELEAEISAATSRILAELLSSLGGVITAAAAAVPQIFLFVLVSVIASVYFSLDLERINRTVASLLPKRALDVLIRFKDGFLLTAIRYLRSYLVIMLITFSVMTFGFVLLGVDYALALAGVVALLDALPIIGIGTVLIPFGIYEIVFGTLRRGIGLFVLYILGAVLRQFLEPKIVGHSLGIHPVVTLILLYGSYTLFGLFGLLLIPLFSVILNVLFEKRREGVEAGRMTD